MPTKLTTIQIDLETYKVIEANRQNFEESLGEILKTMLLGNSDKKGMSSSARSEIGFSMHKPRNYSKVRPEDYSFTFLGSHYVEPTLRDAYKAALLKLVSTDINFLEELSKEKTRARRIVAKIPEDLFFKSPELASNHAEKLVSGWWFDTNLSEAQVIQRLKVACKVAGLEFGSDLILDFIPDNP